MNLHRRVLCLSGILALTACAVAGAAEANPPTPIASVDEEWQELQLRKNPPRRETVQGASSDAVLKIREQVATHYRRIADEAKAFADRHPADPRAAEARCLEALSLLQAAMSGDDSGQARAMALIDEVRKDVRVPKKERARAAALSDIVRLRPQIGNWKLFVAGHEASARNLIAEFPDEAVGFEALLRVAENHPEDAQAAALAREIVAMPAPAGVKTAAEELVSRHALVGQSLLAIAVATLGNDHALTGMKGRPIVLYTWSAERPGSVTRAKQLATFVPRETWLVGVNLDRDTEQARVLATKEGLPGEQIYDARGSDGPLATALKLRKPGQIYVTDSRGEIREVAAQQGNISAKLSPALGSAAQITSTP